MIYLITMFSQLIPLILLKGQDMVGIVPILFTISGKVEGLVWNIHLPKTILVPPNVCTVAGPDWIPRHWTVGARLPLHWLIVVSVHQDLKSGVPILLPIIRIVAVRTHAGGVEAGRALIFANVVGASTVVDWNCSVGDRARKGLPKQVGTTKHDGGRLTQPVLNFSRSQRSQQWSVGGDLRIAVP